MVIVGEVTFVEVYKGLQGSPRFTEDLFLTPGYKISSEVRQRKRDVFVWGVEGRCVCSKDVLFYKVRLTRGL